MKVKFFILRHVIFLARLQEKLITLGSERFHRNKVCLSRGSKTDEEAK